jgi:hypothetical protein
MFKNFENKKVRVGEYLVKTRRGDSCQKLGTLIYTFVFPSVSANIIEYTYVYILYCDMSTHCWVAQQGLRNRALLGSRPVNKIPRRRDDVTLQE